MSLSTSKSKTQLAYASNSINLFILGSTKTTNKPKNKNTTQNQNNDQTKTKHPPRNSTGNIYQSIMGQIDTTQQDYIKSLIVKNQRQSIKNQRDAQKQINKNNEQKKDVTLSKNAKQHETSKKVSAILSHQRTRSQADLIIAESLTNVQTQKIIKTQTEKQITEVSCASQEHQAFNKPLQMKMSNIVPKQMNKKEPTSINAYPSFSTTYPSTEKSDKNNIQSNPIIEALNNTSSSFAKKIDMFELQYPSEQREQRSTHKKVSSKLAGEYFSCQTSPKNGAKNIYTKEVVITTKPSQSSYNSTKNNEHQAATISPISSIKTSNQKVNNKKLSESQQTIPTNFLSSLDEYLQALTLNPSDNQYQNPSEYQQNNRPSNGNMKRSNSTKIKEFSTSKGHIHQPFTLGQQDEEEQTIVLQNGTYFRSNNMKVDQGKLLTFNQQQKLIKSLEKEKKKVSELKSIMDLFNQQLTKYKKKEKKMKQNQYHMIECLKSLNSELTEERRQRRKLQEVVKQFESKIRGISRGKEKKRRESMQDEQRPQRKTIYGVTSTGNNIHYAQPMSNFYNGAEMMERNPLNKAQKHIKKPSANRFSSVINSVVQDYSRDMNNNGQQEYESYNPKKRSVIEEGFGKNRTQKFSKIISTFELENQPFDDEDDTNYRVSKVRNSIKNVHPPNSCKNSYLNSSLPASKQTKSRPMTPKLIQELFKGNKKSRNQQSQQIYNTNNYDSESENENEEFSPEYRRQEYDDQERNDEESSESDSDFHSMQNFQDSSEFEDRNDRAYHMQQNDVLIRMR